MIIKESKMGCLFPLQFSISNVVFFSCTVITNNNEVLHKKLGHPNSNVLTYLLKHGLLDNKDSFSSSFVSFNYATCRLGKSKTLPFFSYAW
jgi:hypothetical protein